MNAPVEQGDPAADLDGFRRSLGEFATGVSVITTAVDGVRYGMTSNSFASVSLKPPLVLWSIRRESQSFSAFEACNSFTVNVLADDQIDLSQRFARSGADKFDGVACAPGVAGDPVLEGSAASFECRLFQTLEGGDHLILLGHVTRFTRHDRQPLLFSKGRYAVATGHPAMRSPPSVAPHDADAASDEPLMASLLVRAYGVVASRLEKDRREAGIGLTLMQARLLMAAQTFPGSTLEALLPELLLDFNASQNVLHAVVTLGLLTVDEENNVHLTPAGQERLREIREHTRAQEMRFLQHMSSGQIEIVKDALRRIVEGQAAT